MNCRGCDVQILGELGKKTSLSLRNNEFDGRPGIGGPRGPRNRKNRTTFLAKNAEKYRKKSIQQEPQNIYYVDNKIQDKAKIYQSDKCAS